MVQADLVVINCFDNANIVTIGRNQMFILLLFRYIVLLSFDKMSILCSYVF